VTVAGRDPGPGRRRDTANPRRARRRALRLLFQADVRDVEVDTLLAAADADPSVRAVLDDDVDADSPEPLDAFTRSLALGVAAHLDEIDALIAGHARRWRVERMPAVDRVVLRLATYELLHEPTSPAVVIDEAVESAKVLSTADSARYVNGVLEAIRRSLHGAPSSG
jgi:transcription antitermination protein NusB